MNSTDPPQTVDSYYGFTPNLGAAIFCLAFFALLGIILFALTVRFRTWYMLSLVGGVVLEVLSFSFRIVGSHDPYNRGAFIAYYIPVLLAPTVFAAASYSVISRMQVFDL